MASQMAKLEDDGGSSPLPLPLPLPKPVRKPHPNSSKGSRWHWLLAPDGSPAMANLPTTSKPKRESPITPSNGKDQKLAGDCDSPISSGTGKDTDTQNDGDLKRMKPGSWFWLRAPDGSPEVSNTTTVTDENQKKAVRSDAAAATATATANDNDNTTGMKPGSWFWLRAPDGSFATASATTAKAKSIATATVKDNKTDMTPGSWFWLRAPDGSFATAGATSAAAAADAGKRKRNHSKAIGPAQKSHRQPSRNTSIVGYTESDDESSLHYDSDDDYQCACDDDDHGNGSSSNDMRRSRYSSCSREKPELWEAKFRLLVQYKNKHGTTRGHSRETSLGRWVNIQCTKYRNKTLSEYRQQRLNSIGFEWNIFVPWMEMYNRLRSYKKQHNGSVCVPLGSMKYKRLGGWVRWQRANYFNGRLSEDRLDLLIRIGFELEPLTDHWMKMYHRLVGYKKKHGATDVPCRWKVDPQLAGWVSQQRARCKDIDRIDLLNDIGFVWDAGSK